MHIKKDQIMGSIVVIMAWLIALSLLYLTLIKLRILAAI